jgi:hypothetical protein
LETKGFELRLSWRDRLSKDLSYNAGFTLGNSNSKILKYSGNDAMLLGNWYAGKTVGEIWAFDVEKIMQTEAEVAPLNNIIDPVSGRREYDQRYIAGVTWNVGDFKYVDHNGDGIIDAGARTLDDHGDLRKVGNSMPHFNYSITAGVNWKNFDLNLFFQGVMKQQFIPGRDNIFYYGYVGGGSPGSESGIFKDSPGLDYWRPANTDPKFGLGPNTDALFGRKYSNNNDLYRNYWAGNAYGVSRFLINAAYLRLKNIQVGYTVPKELSRKIWVQNARIYVSGENVLTFTKLPKAMDPETAIAGDSRFSGEVRGTTYPITKSISLGVNITF